MDTMLLCPEKRLLSVIGIVVNFAVAGAFLFTQAVFVPIFANDYVAKIPAPITNEASIQIISEVSSKAEIKNFDDEQDFICEFTLTDEPPESMAIATPFDNPKYFYLNQKFETNLFLLE